MVVVDYPAQHRRLTPVWAASQLAEDGDALMEQTSADVLLAIERESHDVSFWEELETLTCPALVVRGAGQSAILDEDGLRRYEQSIRHCQTLVLAESGHEVTDDDADRFVRALATFLHELD
ncbi:MAG TPA: alpha/beta hydrolase [Thermomicrobiales bacterium]|nr:alpha/beta hydrolase [Thermomicrobiales bacterium]